MLRFRNIEESEIDTGIGIAERAFRNDPFFSMVSGKKERSYHLLIEMLMKVWLKHQTAFVAENEDKIIGIAIVAPDSLAAISAKECLKLGAGKVIFSCGVKNIISFLKASSFFGQACSKQPAPKYYLTLLAVDINAQGRGIGTAMIQECIVPFLKEEGCKLLCLNTNEEKNRNFYRKNKFDEIGEAEIEINGKCIGNWSYAMKIC